VSEAVPVRTDMRPVVSARFAAATYHVYQGGPAVIPLANLFLQNLT